MKRFARAIKVALFDSHSLQFVDSAFAVDQHSGDTVDSDCAEAFDPTAARAAFYRFWALSQNSRVRFFVFNFLILRVCDEQCVVNGAHV